MNTKEESICLAGNPGRKEDRMSIVDVFYRLHEVEVDENGDYVREYEGHLPHGDLIAEKMVNDWNAAHMEQYFNGILAGMIQSAEAKSFLARDKNGDFFSDIRIRVRGVSGKRFTERIRTEINEQIDAQMSDGWGEGFFGPVNIMTAPDGRRFYPD